MKPIVTIVAAVLALGLVFALSPNGPAGIDVPVTASADDIHALVDANNAFAFDMYSTVASREGNLFLSPYSISSALAMTYAGASGGTASEMAATLRFALVPEQVHAAFSQLNQVFNAGGKGYRLSVANALWAQKGFDFKPDFLTTAKRYYGAGARIVDFAGNTEGARKTINRWVENNTENKIIELIKEGVLDQLTRLVLTNAIYFKGRWEHEFRPESTTNAPFYLAAGAQPADVPFMRQTERFRYAENDEAQVLELPYAGGELAMLVVLPKRHSSIGELEASLKASGLEPIIDMLATRRVAVSLPRFKFAAELSLKSSLQQLGMVDAFDDMRADFSAMCEEHVYITAVLHKAFVEVNEEGTEAAAATGVVVGVRSVMVDEPVTFTADRPFLFAICDLRTDSILFMGRLADPR